MYLTKFSTSFFLYLLSEDEALPVQVIRGGHVFCLICTQSNQRILVTVFEHFPWLPLKMLLLSSEFESDIFYDKIRKSYHYATFLSTFILAILLVLISITEKRNCYNNLSV